MDWIIPRISGDPLECPLQAGGRIFVVGPNGSGKSALFQRLVSSDQSNRVVRIAAHRQTWLPSGNVDVTPSSRQNILTNRRHYDKLQDSQWRDHDAQDQLSAILFDLVDKYYARSSSITQLVDDYLRHGSELQAAATCASETSNPFEQINKVLKQGRLTVALEEPGNRRQLFVQRRGASNARYSIAQMSDGERNAVILAATVLTVPESTILVIDEPERHLHRSISVPLLSALFNCRKDCTFVVGTHELELPLADGEADVLIVRSVQWTNNTPSAWDANRIKAGALPENIKRAILGARRKVLCVEGIPGGLDHSLYGVLFPEISVIPVKGCPRVQATVKGLRNSLALHRVEAYGLIDRDGKTNDQMRQLEEDGVFALATYAVEALYYCSDAIEVVAGCQSRLSGKSAADMISEAKRRMLQHLKKPGVAEDMASKQCLHRVRYDLLSQFPKTDQIRSGHKIVVTPSRDHFSEELECFNQLLGEEKLDDIVARFPITKDVFNSVAKAVKCCDRKFYENVVVTQAQDDEDFARKLRTRIGPLAHKLAG